MDRDRGERDVDTLTLARLYGIQLAYTDMWGNRRRPPIHSIQATLSALGARLDGRGGARAAVREWRRNQLDRWIDEVLVVRPGGVKTLSLRIPVRLSTATAELHLTDERGETARTSINLSEFNDGIPPARERELGRGTWVSKSVPIRWRVAPGYYQLTVVIGSRHRTCLVMAAPSHCYEPAQDHDRKWGVFLPLYALRHRHDWGIGDFEGLDLLCSWAEAQGAGFAATLPLLAGYQGEEEDYSPYAPVSRLFWNELFVDPEQVPECRGEPAVRDYVSSVSVQKVREELRDRRLVDYSEAARLKRGILERAADVFFNTDGGVFEGFAHYLRNNPRLEEYARFRAVQERLGRSWRAWPMRYSCPGSCSS